MYIFSVSTGIQKNERIQCAKDQRCYSPNILQELTEGHIGAFCDSISSVPFTHMNPYISVLNYTDQVGKATLS